MNYKEIIASINKRYVLLQQEKEDIKIYDKLQGAFLFVNHPIINFEELIKELKRRSSKVYKSINELPKPTEKPFDWTTDRETPKENISIRRMFNPSNVLVGVVVTFESSIKIKNLKEKMLIEDRLIDYIHDNIFRNEAISTFRDSYRDIASVIAINNIENLSLEYDSLKIL